MSNKLERVTLGFILLLFATTSVVGITWGLPTRRIDPYLFGDDLPWSGEKIHRLAKAGERFSPDLGADVDVDPLETSANEPVPLTATEEDVAKIYLRYRLYTHQPDEMITMMALAGMNPGGLNFDPRLYQYGGLFVYPVGALIKVCDIFGLIEVRGDLVYYLDNPDEFGKFYIVARAYSAGWGLVGVLVVFLIARRLGGWRAGLLAALLFSLMPVVVCTAHEGKPHLPGAVLMLSAVLFGMRFTSCEPADLAPEKARLWARGRKRDWWLMCICCGAAFGTVLSSLPIFVLVPLIALIGACRPGTPAGAEPSKEGAKRRGRVASFVIRTLVGVAVAFLVYLVVNPYIVINALGNREVLESNFGNSLAMYEIARIGEGFVRVIELTIEGATLPILLLGGIALAVVIARKKTGIMPLAVPAAVFFLQFVLIGAGKPGEYGRFGIFTNTALAIAAACLLANRWGKLPAAVNCVSSMVVVLWTAFSGGLYLANFRADTTSHNWRTYLAEALTGLERIEDTEWGKLKLVVTADPAPYGCPPMNFARTNVVLLRNRDEYEGAYPGERGLLMKPVDHRAPAPSAQSERIDALTGDFLTHHPQVWGEYGEQLWPFETPISWANKPFEVRLLPLSP